METSETITTFLDQVISKIFELPEPTRRLYTQALRDSISVFASTDHESQPITSLQPAQIPSPAQIEQKYQIKVQDQLVFQIVLKKRETVDFLKEQGRSLSPKHELKAGKYTGAFKTRKPAKVGTALVFTYAEVLYLTDHRRLIVLPPKMEEYLANFQSDG